jgi:antirestriction protein ArdC
MNPTTGKRYKGINAIHLMAQGRSDSRWMTYKQAAAAGAQVRKGEKGTPVQYWKFSEEQDKLDDNGRPVLDGKGQPVKETVMLERPRVFFATVFNGEQIDGLPPLQPKKEQTWNAVERAEHILKASGATITHAAGDRAFYRPSTDSITLPERRPLLRDRAARAGPLDRPPVAAGPRPGAPVRESGLRQGRAAR